MSRGKPEIRGRTVEHWLWAAAVEKDAKALELLDEIGDEHLPELCRLVTPTDTSFRRWSETLWKWAPVPLRRWLPDPAWRIERLRVVARVLGQNPRWDGDLSAKIRVANQVARCGSGRDEDYAARILVSVGDQIHRDPSRFGGTDIIRALSNCVTNRSPWVQFHSVHALDHLGPCASDSVPVLRSRYAAGGRTVAQHAAHAVWRITGERQEPLTVLLVSLTSSDKDVLSWTLGYLGELAPQTRSRLPARTVLLSENHGHVGGGSRRLPGTCGLAGPVTCAFLRELAQDPDAELAAAARQAGERVRCAPDAGDR
jgi:hypothetical protein